LFKYIDVEAKTMETVGRLVASRYAGLNYGMSATAVTKGSDR